MALSHLTVIDVATLGAAPQIAAFFGDLGARVIKVEPPRGDALRALVDQHGTAIQWKIINRNKQCVTLDLGRKEGRAILDRMLARADVLVSAHSLTRLERWGLDAASLQARHPRLVSVNLTTYGTTGPWSTRPGSGTLAEASAGLASLTGPKDAPPGLSPVGLGDWLGVLQGIIAALTGLVARGAAPEPQGEHFDVAMIEPILGLLGHRLATSARHHVSPGRHGNRFPTMAPRNTYRTSDGGWVAITAGTDDMVRRLFDVIGRPELADDPRFATNLARVANADELDAILGAWMATRTREEAVATCAAAQVSLAGVDRVHEVLENPHLHARGLLLDVDDGEVGSLTVPLASPRGTRSRAAIRHLGRALGADNDAVYGDWLGLTADEIAALRDARVI